MKKCKRMIMALVCPISVMACAVTAYAADHGCVKVEHRREEVGSYRCIDADTHWTKFRVFYWCQTCHAGMGNADIEVSQYHTWGVYVDLGHSSAHSHKYQVICSKCNGTREVQVACSGNSGGRHETPW